MGCLQAKEKEEPDPPPMKEPEVKKVDPRLPFENYRQLFNMKNSWKAVGRTLTNTAKECLMRLFKAHPEYQQMHKNLAKYDDMEKLMESTAFENAALDIFNMFDEVMETTEKVDMHIGTLQRAGKAHAKIPGFTANYFRDMETPFMEAVKLSLGDRFTEATEKNFQLFFNYVVEQMLIGYNQAGGQPAPDSNRV